MKESNNLLLDGLSVPYPKKIDRVLFCVKLEVNQKRQEVKEI